MTNTTSNTAVCLRCGGTGATTHKHVENGLCFRCNGTGRVERVEGTARPVTHAERQSHIEALRATFCRWRRAIASGVPAAEFAEYDNGLGCSPATQVYRTASALDSSDRARVVAAFNTLLNLDIAVEAE